MCPNINNENVRNQFNSIIKAFGGAPMTIEEFKNKELRNQRSGVDDSAMQIAYSVWYFELCSWPESYNLKG